MVCAAQNYFLFRRENASACVDYRREVCHAYDVAVAVHCAQEASRKHSVRHSVLTVVVIFVSRSNIAVLADTPP